MADYKMPSLGADMDTGTLLEWKVKPGDTVKKGQIVAVVDTEKASLEIEIFFEGVVEELLVHAGEKVAVGTVIARVRTPGEAARALVAELAARPAAAAAPPPAARAPEPVAESPAPPAPAAHPPHITPVAKKIAAEKGVDVAALRGSGIEGAVTRADVEKAATGPAGSRAKVSPLARRLATERGVDLSGVTGTGEGGVITASDVERAAAKPRAAVHAAPSAITAPAAGTQPTPAAPAARAPMTQADRKDAMRRVIAAAMARSKREIPHYYLGHHIDMRRALAWLEAENLKRPVTARILPAALLLRATVHACQEFPDMNGVFVEGEYRPGKHVNLGVAISLRQGGLVAPAIMEAETKDLSRLMEDLKDLVKRTRAGTLRGSELSESTITVTNLGDLGVEAVYGVIYPPQVALVGFGRVMERAWAEGGLVGARPVVVASLSADHRVSDGLRGALFLGRLDKLLQEPEKL